MHMFHSFIHKFIHPYDITWSSCFITWNVRPLSGDACLASHRLPAAFLHSIASSYSDLPSNEQPVETSGMEPMETKSPPYIISSLFINLFNLFNQTRSISLATFCCHQARFFQYNQFLHCFSSFFYTFFVLFFFGNKPYGQNIMMVLRWGNISEISQAKKVSCLLLIL